MILILLALIFYAGWARKACYLAELKEIKSD